MRRIVPEKPAGYPEDEWVATLPAAEAERHQPAELTSSSACLEPEIALSLVTGRVLPEQQAALLRHVDRCGACQQRILEAASNAPPSSGARTNARRLVLQPGGMVDGRYFVRCFLNRGGMGEVYEAFDCDLRERIALKTVTASLIDDTSAVVRLKAEVQLARRVGHPNVCRVYDLGTNHDAESGSLHFLTMEYIAGRSLSEHLREVGPLDVDTAIRWGIAMLDGLSAAHSAGVLHRDFKTGNVMLRGDGNTDLEPVLMDFGLASALNPGTSKLSGSDGSLAGSLAYMAPEQLEGQSLDFTTDIYSFGAVLFEMLTGRLAFQANTPAATLARLRTTAPKASEFTAAIPPELDAIVARCLARKRGQRFPSAKAVRDALSQVDSTTVPMTAMGVGTRRLWVATVFGASCLGIALWLASRPTLTPTDPKATRLTGFVAAATPGAGALPSATQPAEPARSSEAVPPEPQTTPPSTPEPQTASAGSASILPAAKPPAPRAQRAPARPSALSKTRSSPDSAPSMKPLSVETPAAPAPSSERPCGPGLLCPAAFR